MKKLFAISTLALAAAVSLNAKTADELRIYINPGHGSWTADDRPSTLVGHGAYNRYKTDTLSFFESNTNLRKGFGVLEALRAYGLKFDPTLNQTGERWQIGAARDLSQNIVMSHVKCGPFHDDNGTANQLGDAAPADIDYYNRNLSEVCAEVTANNFDMFISIHSNAATEGTTTNYPLFLYGGYDTPKEGTGHNSAERQTLSRAMSQAAWKYAIGNTHMQWTAYTNSTNIRGDIDFYHGSSSTGYLGALKHSAPGFLVEGYFHTYQPARHRAMNWDVDYLEGLSYAHGIADYFGLDKEKTGVIYGIVRDKNEKFRDAAYSPNPTTDDAYLPLNGVKVILKKDGVQVGEYTTDNYYNGAYVFARLEPGKYTVEFENEQYLAGEPVEVEVKAATISYPKSTLVNKDWTPPAIIYKNYDNVVVPGTIAADEYEFNQSYTDEAVAELEGKTVRRGIAKGNTLYILAHDAEKNPTIIVYDGANKAVLANVSTEGTQGSVYAISDIQLTADGVLVATNMNLNHYDNNQVQAGETRGYNRLYRWEKDEKGAPTGAPIEFGKSMLSANFYRANIGSAMAYSGTLEEGKIVVMGYTMSTTAKAHSGIYNVYTILDGAIASANFNNEANADLIGLEVLGGTDINKVGPFSFVTSPLDEDKFIVTGAKGKVGEYGFRDVVNIATVMPEGFVEGSKTAAFFQYNNHSYMVAEDNADGKNGGVKIIDITEGVDKPEVIGTINTTLPEAADAAVAASIVPVLDAEENVKAAYINLYAVRDGKISRMTTEGVTVKANPVGMAYNLKATAGDDSKSYTLTFNTNEEAKEANIILTPENGDEEVVIPVADLKKGENTITVTDADITPEQNYSWSVELVSKTVPVSGLVSSEKNSLGVRGGVLNFNDPTNDAFGRRVVIYGKNNGFDVYDAEGSKIYEKLHKGHAAIAPSGDTNQSNAFRGSVYNEYGVFPCWGDKGGGVVMANFANTDEEPFSLFRNGTNNGTGNYILNGENLGGGSAGACIIGEPDKATLYSVSEDHLNGNGGGASEMGIVKYKLSAAPWAVEAKPEVLPSNGYISLLANKSADLVPYGNGFFAIHNRGAGNNVTGCPGFIYVSAADDEVKFNSGTLEELNSVLHGLAITHDGKTLAVCTYTGINVYDVTWNGDTPSMTLRYTFKSTTPVTYNTLSFDYAGNLYHYIPSNGVYKYALAQESPKVVTPANEMFAVKASSGVEDITIEEADNNAPVEYFNINGVRVNSDNLTPGIYIKRQGKKVEKIVIR